MRRSLAERSLLLFVIAFVVTLGQTLFESTIGAWSFGVQRWIIFLGIILPAGAGAVFGQHREVADALGLPEKNVRIISPDVGGSFGLKTVTHPEVVCGAAISRRSDTAQ